MFWWASSFTLSLLAINDEGPMNTKEETELGRLTIDNTRLLEAVKDRDAQIKNLKEAFEHYRSVCLSINQRCEMMRDL